MNVHSNQHRPGGLLLRAVSVALLVTVMAAAMPGYPSAQEDGRAAGPGASRSTIWDLHLGSHARELGRDVYVDLACGTNGGPPSKPLKAWTDFGECQPEPGTGLREVYFRYDDVLEYRDKALDPLEEAPFRFEGTTEFQQPVIVSALFDANGFVAGLRLVTDPRTTPDVRERGVYIAGALRTRFGSDDWACEDLPAAEGETPYKAVFTKERCTGARPANNMRLALESHYYRKKGQLAVDPVTRQVTEGYFVSETRFEALAIAPVTDIAERLARIAEPEPTAVEVLAERVRQCRECDLKGMDLRRADLRGANLAGADLSGAILHAADLSGADLTGATLRGANLNRTDLRRAKLAGAVLDGSMAYAVRLDGADLTGAHMVGVRAARAEMTGIDATGLTASDSDFRLARLLNATLDGADISYSLLSDTQFARANLEGASLEGSRLWNASLIGANLRGAKVQLADLTNANLRQSDLTAADFSQSVLRFANVAEATTIDTNFEGATLPPGLRR